MLPAVLVVVGALLILAVGALLVASIERSTARSFVDRKRAELAAAAGLEEVRGIMHREMANDDYLIIQSSLGEAITPGRESAAQLFLARGEAGVDGYDYRYVPLFSSLEQPPIAKMKAPEVESLLGSGADNYIDFITLPYTDKVRAAWLPVRDEDGQIVARYAYWVEDLQGKIDAGRAGNTKQSKQHVRAEWPFPAPGLNGDDVLGPSTGSSLDQIALYAVDPEAREDAQGSAGEALIQNRRLLVSPDSVLAAAGVSAPLQRGEDGHLVDGAGRGVEENVVAGLRSYLEQPLVPFSEGIDPSVAGEPKLNLNRLLATGGDAAVREMAAFVEGALPLFEERKGGFPDNYLETLAANALDYADEDGESTFTADRYRGVDSYPLVSEFLMRFRWGRVYDEDDVTYIELSVSTYVELWNMSDQEVTGDAEVSYECAATLSYDLNPNRTLADLTHATPKLVKRDGYHWFPAIQVSLKPNEYRVIKCGTLSFKLESNVDWVPAVTLSKEIDEVSVAGYRMKWNGTLVDQSRGAVHRYGSTLSLEDGKQDEPGTARVSVRASIPSHSHVRDDGTAYRNNMGDPRMSFYNLAKQAPNAYPGNYSPNRRNVRWNVYRWDKDQKQKVWGRVMPSEWPDGGHNSTLVSNAFVTGDTRIPPDDPIFFPEPSSVLRDPVVEEAPMRLSNLGRFYSATELGRVYDPIMWDVSMPGGGNRPWGDVETTTQESTDHGGGNTLRIGRREHSRFDSHSKPGMEAWHLLDLFHAGQSRSDSAAEREGPLVRIEGHVNLNTASRDVLRAVVAGAFMMDPAMCRRTSDDHDLGGLMAPPVSRYELDSGEVNTLANRIADGIIAARKTAPFTSVSSIAEAMTSEGKPVFGNTDLLPNGDKVHRSDSASEEMFARVYESSTVRSRNFRVWVVGQSVAPVGTGGGVGEILAEVRRCYTVFADPGERDTDGRIDSSKVKPRILYENDF